jgi:hypothetical protein
MTLQTTPFANAFAQPAPAAQPALAGRFNNAFNANLGPDANLPWHSGPQFTGTVCRISDVTKKNAVQPMADTGIVLMNGQTRHRVASMGGTRQELELIAQSFGLLTEKHQAALAESMDACTLARLHLRQLIVDHIGTQQVTITCVPSTRKQGQWDFGAIVLGTAAAPAATAAAPAHDFSRFQ